MSDSMTSPPPGLPRQFLRPLLTIALTVGPSYGYELTERLNAQGLHMIDTAAIYRMLRKMERELLVESWWERSANGPHRRVHKLTPTGHEAALKHIEELSTIIDLLGQAVSSARKVDQ